ncbi:MAG: hypothetical protein WD135_03425, partial [Ferruginibacter sp.]
IVYAINPQEGDGHMVVQEVSSGYKKTIARGYSAVITEDSKYAIFKIKPVFQDTRQAKIKKKKPDEMPKDSLVIVQLGTDSIVKISRVKSFKVPEKAAGWVAYQMEKSLPDTSAKKKPTVDSLKLRIDMLSKLADSLIRKSLDSVKGKIEKEEVIHAAQKAVKEIYKKADELAESLLADADGDEVPGAAAANEGTELILKNLVTGTSQSFKQVNEYQFDEKANFLLLETGKATKDSNNKALVILLHLPSGKKDTVLRGFNDAKNYVFDKAGKQLSFVAERDSSAKALQKFYKLWYYKNGSDSASMLADKNTVGMKIGQTVSENALLSFSKDGQKLFFGVAPIQPAKDTNLVDFELARLDI